MKNIRKHINFLLAASILAAGFASCDRVDYPDRFRPTKGVPSIFGVKYVESGVVTDQAFMEEVLCIMGENLCSVHELYFNDQAAVLNTSYMTDYTLLVSVPKNMPKVETDKIYFITSAKDTVTYDFRVLPPAPKAKEMSFEYAEPGSVVSIYGDYFYEKGQDMTVEFTGAEVPHSDIEIVSLNEIKVKIPAGAQPGYVKVSTGSGISKSAFQYKDPRGLLFDFDGTNGLYTANKGWHPTPIAEGIGVDGSNCLKLDGTAEDITADGGDWHDGNFHFEYWAGNWQNPETYGTWDGRRLCDIVDFTNWKNMCLKFELKIPAENPWTGCPCQIIVSDVTLVSNGDPGVKDIYGNTLGGCNNTYLKDSSISLPRYLWRPWQATGSYDTNNEWVTVTIPYASFTSFWDGTSATGNLTPDSFANLEFFFAAGTTSEGKGGCKPILYIDNIRAVPVK